MENFLERLQREEWDIPNVILFKWCKAYPKGPVDNLVGQYTWRIVDSLSFKRQDNHRKQPLIFTFLMNKEKLS